MAKIMIGGESFDVPPLPIATIRKTARTATRMEELRGESQNIETMEEALDLAVDLVVSWLSRAYPHVTAEYLEERMTLEDIQAMGANIGKVMSGQGIESAGEPKDAEAGQDRPRRSPSTSNSTASSANSSRRASRAAAGI